MRVYLAAAWGRRKEIAKVARRLRAVGVVVTSGWLVEEKAMQTVAREKFLRDRAYIDLNDVDRADAIVRFTDPESTAFVSKALISGARHFEMGYARARGKTMYVVGGHQNIFDQLDGIVHLHDADELVARLSQEE